VIQGLSPVVVLDAAAVFVFALTGALAASRAQLDIVGFVFLACLTAVGGGTVRDLLLGRPPFWMARPEVLAVATLAAALVFLTAHRLESRMRTLMWCDACALAVAVPAGLAAAVAEGQPWPVVLLMAMATGCFGGLMRDIVVNEVPLVLRAGELYLTAAAAGAGAGLAVWEATGLPPAGLLTCAALTFALRAGSLALGWKLPVYRARPPRR
jgi:uncharacterized membrane protein YeiH